jgi:diaminohydroxyphosphoribosylaminopyrimidine deaminase/5-amino-6-(5-phosphoribosylamino)uracil reductase
VIARDGDVLGEGAHHYDTYDHAEIVALKQAAALGHAVRGATAYVTLEPCSHHGRTGPCADALIAAGVSRCVVATVDPNPVVRGRGMAKLRDAGVEVVVAEPSSLQAREARRLNDAFAFSVVHGQPFVTMKVAMSLDGMIAPPASQRTAVAPHWITGEEARADAQMLRHASDAILTGIGTVLADDPSLTDRTRLERRRRLLKVIVDSGLRTPIEAAIAREVKGDLLLMVSQQALLEQESLFLQRGADVVRLREDSRGRLDLREALEHLQLRQIRSVLLECGSELNAAFLKAGLVDRVVLYVSETELGEGSVPFARGFGSPYRLQEALMDVRRVEIPNGALVDVRIEGYLRDPWDNV